MAAPKLVVALVELREEVQALWLPERAAEMLRDELAQVVSGALSASSLQDCISSLIIEPRCALISLAEATAKAGCSVLVTMGSDSVLDEEEVQKLQSENESAMELHYSNLNAEGAEVVAGQRPNVWVGLTMPTGSAENWRVVRLSCLQGYDVKTILKGFPVATLAAEEVKAEEVPQNPKFQAPTDPYLGKTPEQARALFLEEVKLDSIHAPSFPLENQSDLGEMLVHFLCGMQQICKSATGKFQKVLPHLGPSQPVDVPRLEAVLRTFSLTIPKIDPDPVAFPQVRRLQTSIRNLDESSTLLNTTLQSACTAFSQLQLPSRPSSLFLELRRTEAGQEVHLVNSTDASLVGSVRYVNQAGLQMSIYENVAVAGRGSVNCLGGDQYEEWKKAGLARMEVVEGLGIDV